MSWTDKGSIKVIKYLKDKYKIDTFVETGTFKGINARFHSKNFKHVITCEKIIEYYYDAMSILKDLKNVICLHKTSPKFLRMLNDDKYIFYLDAHFYDKKLTKSKRFVVLEELENMKRFKDSVIIIHDFQDGLGGLRYDDIDLNMDLLRDKLNKINNFYFYTNILRSIDPVTAHADDIIASGLEVDYETLKGINFVWSSRERIYRGILYCLPTKLTKKEQDKLGLREVK